MKNSLLVIFEINIFKLNRTLSYQRLFCSRAILNLLLNLAILEQIMKIGHCPIIISHTVHESIDISEKTSVNCIDKHDCTECQFSNKIAPDAKVYQKERSCPEYKVLSTVEPTEVVPELS